MAEHPETLAGDQLDLPGFAVGVVERDGIIDDSSVQPALWRGGIACPPLVSAPDLGFDYEGG